MHSQASENSFVTAGISSLATHLPSCFFPSLYFNITEVNVSIFPLKTLQLRSLTQVLLQEYVISNTWKSTSLTDELSFTCCPMICISVSITWYILHQLPVLFICFHTPQSLTTVFLHFKWIALYAAMPAAGTTMTATSPSSMFLVFFFIASNSSCFFTTESAVTVSGSAFLPFFFTCSFCSASNCFHTTIASAIVTASNTHDRKYLQ